MPQRRCAPLWNQLAVPVNHASSVPSVPAWKPTQIGKAISAKSRNTIGNQPRGPGKSIQRWRGCAPVRIMWRAVANTSTHLSRSTSTKNQIKR